MSSNGVGCTAEKTFFLGWPLREGFGPKPHRPLPPAQRFKINNILTQGARLELLIALMAAIAPILASSAVSRRMRLSARPHCSQLPLAAVKPTNVNGLRVLRPSRAQAAQALGRRGVLCVRASSNGASGDGRAFDRELAALRAELTEERGFAFEQDSASIAYTRERAREVKQKYTDTANRFATTCRKTCGFFLGLDIAAICWILLKKL